MSSVQETPLFPLPNVLLYPDAILPLHIFEPRYLAMVEDMLENQQNELVLGLLEPGWEDTYFKAPPIYKLAGLGKLMQWNRTENGRYNILVQGLKRVQLLEEMPGEKPYRRVKSCTVEEIQPQDPAEEKEMRERIRQGLIEFADGSLLLPDKATLSYLTDVLLVALPIDVQDRQVLFSILDVQKRAQATLERLTWLSERRRSLADANDNAENAPWN